MFASEAIARNFRFMIVQVTKQIEQTLGLVDDPDPRRIQAVRESDDYIDSLKSMIENKCFAYLADLPSAGGDEASSSRFAARSPLNALRAVTVIASNLERVADFSVNITRQIQRLGSAGTLRRFGYRPYFDLVLEALGLIDAALFNRDSAQALRICQVEDRLDRLYGTDIEQIVAALRAGREVENHITVLFILHYLERMGDALLNIGEAILFAVLGERIKIQQYRVLAEALESADAPPLSPAAPGVQLQGIWGTRSGVRVGTVMEAGARAAGGPVPKMLFKEGNPAKLQAEKESLQRWEQIAPGLAPRVVEFEQQGEDAALLLQYLDGITFQEMLLSVEEGTLQRALRRIEQTLMDIWSRTRVPRPVPAEFLGQLVARLDDVYRVHPQLRQTDTRFGPFRLAALQPAGRDGPGLLAEAQALEAELAAPFAVQGHGDFNLDNIIYNRVADRVHFVDLHRSGEMDYVQDVSVFLVSAFRLPVFVPRVRTLLESVALDFLAFARRFAADHGDAAFEPRLALGVVRSLVTSTRFELNRSFARAMFERAVFLLRKLTAHRGRPWPEFTMPDDILIH